MYNTKFSCFCNNFPTIFVEKNKTVPDKIMIYWKTWNLLPKFSHFPSPSLQPLFSLFHISLQQFQHLLQFQTFCSPIDLCNFNSTSPTTLLLHHPASPSPHSAKHEPQTQTQMQTPQPFSLSVSPDVARAVAPLPATATSASNIMLLQPSVLPAVLDPHQQHLLPPLIPAQPTPVDYLPAPATTLRSV